MPAYLKRTQKWEHAADLRQIHFAFLERLTGFAESRWPGFTERAEELFAANYFRVPNDGIMCAAFSLLEERFEGRTVLETLLATEPELTAAEAQMVEAERAAWLSWWEVLDSSPRSGIRLRDLLTGAERVVFDEKAVRTARRGVVMCCRVLDFDGVGLFSGGFPLALPKADPRMRMLLSVAEEMVGPTPTAAKVRRDPVGILNGWRMCHGLLRPGVVPEGVAVA